MVVPQGFPLVVPQRQKGKPDELQRESGAVIPAKAGMMKEDGVIPAQAGIQGFCQTRWIPGSACGGPGMTDQGLLRVLGSR